MSQMLADRGTVGEVVGTLLEPSHFYHEPYRLLYSELVNAYYADEPTDPLSIANAVAKPLARQWMCEESEATRRLEMLAQQARKAGAADHAGLIKRKADFRSLASLGHEIAFAALGEEDDPEAIAGEASHTAMQIATSGLLTQEIIDFEQLGKRYILELRKQIEARNQGIELGAYFGMPFLDAFLRGLRPSELFILGGEPGAGKSAVIAAAVRSFAERQAKREKEKQIGTLILALEMAEEPTSMRVAQAVGGLEGAKLREARVSDAEVAQLTLGWGRRKKIPLYHNFASTMRATQLKAMVVDAIHRHHVGLVVIDHFRYVEMDGEFRSALEAEEALAQFLKQDIATQLNVAVVCLAHTTKALAEDGRPALVNLRGGQLVAGHSDWVAFVYRPFMYAKPEQIEKGVVKRTDAEMIWAKTRHGVEGSARFHFDPTRMEVR